MSELVFNRVILERNNRTLMILSAVSLVLNFVLVLGLMRAFQKPPLVVYAQDGEITVLKTKSLSVDETLLKDFIRLIAGQYLSFSVNSLPKQIDAIRPYLGAKSIQSILQSYKDNQAIIENENISQQFIVNTVTITKNSNPFWVEVNGIRNIYAAGNNKSMPMTYIFEVTKVKSTENNPYGFLMTDIIEKGKLKTKDKNL